MGLAHRRLVLRPPSGRVLEHVPSVSLVVLALLAVHDLRGEYAGHAMAAALNKQMTFVCADLFLLAVLSSD